MTDSKVAEDYRVLSSMLKEQYGGRGKVFAGRMKNSRCWKSKQFAIKVNRVVTLTGFRSQNRE